MSTEMDELSARLLKETSKLAGDYPVLTKLILDMVEMVSAHAEHLTAITTHIEVMAMEMNRQKFVLDDIMRDFMEVDEAGKTEMQRIMPRRWVKSDLN